MALTRTLADGVEGSGILYLVCREADEQDLADEDTRGKAQLPQWLPQKYRHLWKWDKSNQPEPEVKTNWVEVALQKCLDTTLLKDRLLLESAEEKCLDTISIPESITNSQKPQRLIVVSVPQVKAYERVVTSRPVTFTCQHSNQTVIQERMPGPIPSYCSARCQLDAAAARKRASRAITGKNKGRRGRPKKINV